MRVTFNTSPKFDDWREYVTKRVQWAVILVSTPVLLLTVLDGSLPLSQGLFGMAGILVLCISFGISIPTRIKVYILVAILLFASIAVTSWYGVVGGGRLYMGLAVILSATLLGQAAALAVFCATLFIILALGIAVLSGVSILTPESIALSSKASWWLWYLAVYVFNVGVALFSVNFIIARLRESFAIEEKRSLEKDQAIDRLTEMQERFQLLEANISDTIWTMDLDFNYTYVSPSVTKLRGYTQEEAMRVKPDDLTHPDELIRWVEIINEGFAQDSAGFDPDRSQLIQSRVLHKDGHLVDVEIKVGFLRDENGKPYGLHGVTRDVSERRRLEELMESVLTGTRKMLGVDFFESLASNLARTLEVETVLLGELVDAENVRTLAVSSNGKIKENFDYALLGTPSEQVVQDKICSYPADVQAQFPDDHLLVEMNANSYLGSLIRDPTGKAIGLIAAMDENEIPDVGLAGNLLAIFANYAAAELARQQESREKEEISYQLLQSQKLDSIGQLAGGVAHDYNNLLLVMVGYLDLIEMKELADPEFETAIKEIRKSADRATALTRQLLSFSRRQIVEFQTIDMSELLTGLQSLFMSLLPANINYTFKPIRGTTVARGDTGQLEQAIMNLVVNARDAMPNGGDLSLSLSNVVVDAEYVDTHPWASEGSYVKIDVADTGIGMSAYLQELIFEPFFTTKPQGEGTGLGLSVYFGIVKQHGGFSHVYSEEGSGTKISTYIPCIEDDVVETTTSPGGQLQPGSETILLVEDNEPVRKLSERVLSHLGYRVLVAVDGEEGIEQFKAHNEDLDLVILDVILPGINGDVVRENMRKINPDIPVLFTSGYSPDGIHVDFVLKDDVEFIQKPYRTSDLIEKVRQIINAG